MPINHDNGITTIYNEHGALVILTTTKVYDQLMKALELRQVEDVPLFYDSGRMEVIQ